VTEPINDPAYWRVRLAKADPLHHAVFKCPTERWRAIEAKHREILARLIAPGDSVLDAGCAWGRLLNLLPSEWYGYYLGVDLSPDFVAKAREDHPHRDFRVLDLRDLVGVEPAGDSGGKFEWAVMVSIRPMVRRNLGDEAWEAMERELRRVAKRLLYLEYDPDSEGSVE
jgi:hypothetical protein